MFDYKAYHREYYKKWCAANPEKARAYALKSYHKHKEKRLAVQRASRAANREVVNARAAEYRLAHPNYQHEWYLANLEKKRVKSKQYNIDLKIETVAAYGGKCICCGQTDWHFLTIDHIDKRGRDRDKDENGKNITGYRLYLALRKLGYPQGDYRCLCFDCNCVRGVYGFCPHEKQKLDFLEVVA